MCAIAKQLKLLAKLNHAKYNIMANVGYSIRQRKIQMTPNCIKRREMWAKNDVNI